MFSSSGEDNNLNNSKSTLSSSSNNSTCSLSSHSPSSTLFSSIPKSMEEVWKDINLPSLHNNPSAGFRSVPLQDFLARPFSSKDSSGRLPAVMYGASPTPPSPPTAAARPSPLFNLNTDPDHHHRLQFLDDPNCGGGLVGPLRMPFDDVLMGGGLNSFPENVKSSGGGGGGGERRHKRMIKNRESASRSRARKQAYINELELEVERLKEENARLKKQQQQLNEVAAEEEQYPKKSTLQRQSTAPF